jgi:hypothetical protein
MQETGNSRCGRPHRRLILGAAFALGLVAALAPRTPAVLAAGPAIVIVQAETPRPSGTPSAEKAQKGAKSADAKAAGGVVAPPPIPAPPALPEAAPDTDAPDALDKDVDTAPAPGAKSRGGHHGIVVDQGGKRVVIEGLGRDREYDSFEQFVQDAPWLAGLVFLVVLLVFLVPLLIIVLLIWYKIRKNRMANETMLKLAERGALPPTTAMDAVASGNAVSMAAAATSAPAGTPAYEHARALQRQTVWSDLRKGIILSGVGLGLTFFSMMDDGTPNSVGLIFLFVGLGYCLLWYLEDRTRTPQRGPSGTPPAGG